MKNIQQRTLLLPNVFHESCYQRQLPPSASQTRADPSAEQEAITSAEVRWNVTAFTLLLCPGTRKKKKLDSIWILFMMIIIRQNNEAMPTLDFISPMMIDT